MDSMTETAGEAAGSGFFTAYTPDGRPYLGLNLLLPGCSISLLLSDQGNARDHLSAFQKTVNELMKMRPKLLIVPDVTMPSVNGDSHA